jgi:hypothetical protein
MTSKPSLVEVRTRVRTCETWEILLLASALQNMGIVGNPPKAAVERFQAMREEAIAELERRGVVVAANPDLVAFVTYGGEHLGRSPTLLTREE